MLQQQLQQHQWKAFRRNPMFERNLGVRIFMYIMFGFVALEFLSLGFFLDKLLLTVGTYTYAIDVFNSIVLYLFVVDFVVKCFGKTNQSMQIAPYLALPIKRNRLYNFLLIKEFSSFWNLFWLFSIVPFALKSITPYFGFGTAILYILFFYLLCVGVSLLVNLINNLLNRSFWFYILPLVLVAVPLVVLFATTIPLGEYMQKAGDLVLNNKLSLWSGLFMLLTVLWVVNLNQMDTAVYRELQGEKIDKASSFSSVAFLDRFGAIGDFMNLEIKMILRSKRLKQQAFAGIFFVVYFFAILYVDMFYAMRTGLGNYNMHFFGIMTIGIFGITMGQFIFTAESSFFDGLMSRKVSMYEVLKSKYLLYSTYSLLITLLLLIPVWHGRLGLLSLVSSFFYVVGPIYFMSFQNAVYNKNPVDLFDKGSMNWKGQSGTTVVLSMVTVFVPVILVSIVQGIFGGTTACMFMLIVGMAFTFTSKYWLRNIYKRFEKRKYKNMEGFRS
ncbi:hypothetical protein AGMMS4957_01270 [Bacteroidia bacterium]|nr:hypothetical protein AGMMS4957_01270 [Bacteroidia bacterium]